MKKTYKQIYQFKITLKHIKPPVWRRIQVPENYSFWDLHVAIQDAMGWTDSHLHAFAIKNPATGLDEQIGSPGDSFSNNDQGALPTKKRYQNISLPKIKKLFISMISVMTGNMTSSWKKSFPGRKMLNIPHA